MIEIHILPYNTKVLKNSPIIFYNFIKYYMQYVNLNFFHFPSVVRFFLWFLENINSNNLITVRKKKKTI